MRKKSEPRDFVSIMSFRFIEIIIHIEDIEAPMCLTH